MDGRERGEDRAQMRAADADRQVVADRLRAALDEGRLDLDEYDARVRDAYAARTYGELDPLLADLPAGPPAPAGRSGMVSADRPAPARAPHAARQWLVKQWESYLTVAAICIGIWAVTGPLTNGGAGYFWPGWVIGPWGVILLVRTISGLAGGEPHRWASEHERRRVEREQRRRRYRALGEGDPRSDSDPG